MRIKQDGKLAIIARAANRDAVEVAQILGAGLLTAGLVKDTPENYGLPVKECIDTNKTLVDVFREIGIERVNYATYTTFLDCVIMGDGDCPECGGEMEICDSIEHEIPSVNRNIPPDYKTDWEKLRCPVCGHTIEHDYRPDYD